MSALVLSLAIFDHISNDQKSLQQGHGGVKPASHMPPTYLEAQGVAAGTAPAAYVNYAVAYVNIYRRHIICLRHWPPACLRSWTEFNFAGKPAVVGDSRWWKYFMWTSSAVAAFFIKTIRSIFRGKMVENCAIRFAFRANLSLSVTHRRCAGDPQGQVLERYQLQPAT